MTDMRRTLDFKYILVAILVVVGSTVCDQFFREDAKGFIRIILESRIAIILSWLIPGTIFLMHYIKFRSRDLQSEAIITTKFGMFMDNALGGLIYGTMISTAITLLKGLYIQTIFKEKLYFADLNQVDVLTVFGGLAFLLYYPAVKIIGVAIETFRVEHTEHVRNAQKEVVVPSDEVAKP